jgi:hypothetical protein
VQAGNREGRVVAIRQPEGGGRQTAAARQQGQGGGEKAPVLRRDQANRVGAHEAFRGLAEPGAEGAGGKADATVLRHLHQQIRRGEGEGDETFSVAEDSVAGWAHARR